MYTFTDPHYVARPETGSNDPWVMDVTGNGIHGRYVKFTSFNSRVAIGAVEQNEWSYNGGGVERGDYSGNRADRRTYNDGGTFTGRHYLGHIEIFDANYDMTPFQITPTTKHTLMTFIAHDNDGWWWSLSNVDWYQYTVLNYNDGAGKGPIFSGSTHRGSFYSQNTGGAWTRKYVEYIPYTTPDTASSCYDKYCDNCCRTGMGIAYYCCDCWRWQGPSTCEWIPNFSLRHYEIDFPANTFSYRITDMSNNWAMGTASLAGIDNTQTITGFTISGTINGAANRHTGAWTYIPGMIGVTVFYNGESGFTPNEERSFNAFGKSELKSLSCSF